MENPIMKLRKLIKHQRFKEAMVIYILFNLGILLTIYGSVLYSPALIPDQNDITPEGARMEIINLTKGALISQNFDILEYNIGFDMLNIGGIFLIIGLLYHNYLEASCRKGQKKKSRLKIYKLRKKGTLQGNFLEWLCLVVFSFAFFTFLHNIFVYIIIISFTIGVIGFTIRKFQVANVLAKPTYS
jgi:hypothetical protein